MNKIESLQHFNENHVKIKAEEKLNAAKEYYQKHREELKEDFLKSFKKMCLKITEMQKSGQKDKIGYITYSMLRINMFDKKYGYFVDASNKFWFFDTEECRIEYDASWAFRFLDQFETELEDKRKLYISKILKHDIERIKLKQMKNYNRIIVELARYAFKEGEKVDEYRQIDREDVLEVRVGEYKGLNEVVYKEDVRVKESDIIKGWLEEKFEYEYEHEILKNLDLSGGDYEGINLMYGDFSGSNLSGSNMKRCLFNGAKFRNCLLEKADFRGANLEGADFEEANLKNAVFTGAHVKGLCIKGADLEGAVFSKEDMEKLELDEQQKNVVIRV